MSDGVTILISTSAAADLTDRILAVAPRAKVISLEQFQENPALVERAEIVYGHLSGEAFSKAQKLKWLQGTSAGIDWLERNHIPPHPAIITKARIHAEVISEHLFGMLLHFSRKLNEAVEHQRHHTWKGPASVPMRLKGKTLCVLGLGVIGRQCARVAEAMGMDVIGVKRMPEAIPSVRQVYCSEGLHEALAQADVIMAILPNTPGTQKMLDRAAFEAMREGVMIFNAGRGSTIDTEALVDSLRTGRVRAAGLDVTDPEPLPKDHPLWDFPNVLITSHYSGWFPEYSRETEKLFLENLRRFLNGQPLRDVADREAGY